jgi:signal transduction histidine kinase
MIIYPVRRAVTSFVWFVAALVGLYGVTLAFFWWFALPTLLDFQIMTALLGGGVLIVGAAGFVAYHMRYIYRVPRVGAVVLAGYLLAAGLILVMMWVAGSLLFIHPYDALLVVILMLFAAGVVAAIGYIQSAAITDKLASLTNAAESLAMGRYHVRVEIDDNDELSRLAAVFNAMAARLESADRKEHQLNHLRRDLMAWIGYDLRVPLLSARTTIGGIAEGLATEPERVKPYLRTARRDITALSDLIDDLYDMAQLDINGIHLQRTPAHIDELIEDAVATLLHTAEQKNITLTSRCMPGIPLIAVDVRQISRVLTNLVEDAIQRVPKGGSVKINAYPARNGALIEIIDTFEGLRPEDADAIFKLFFGDEDVRGQAQATVRLRLALADAIVRAHGSQIHPQRLGVQGLRLVFTLAQDGDIGNLNARGM